jgi:4-hydroxy-4-methyl-2-oxoglutarate aldolase
MSLKACLHDDELEALRLLDTCTVSNAIETFQVRLRNTGFADARLRCMFEDLPPMVGYAATARLRTGEPPIAGRVHCDRADWWKSILAIPSPRIVVLADLDNPPGRGAFLGDMHAAILRSLGCVGYVTNGAVRELPRVRELGLQVFAGNVTVSHAYAHIFDCGCAVTVGGLDVHPGDLLHGDRHGLLTVPSGIACEIPRVAARLQQEQQKIIDFCCSREFSVNGLGQIMDESREWQGASQAPEKVGVQKP